MGLEQEIFGQNAWEGKRDPSKIKVGGEAERAIFGTVSEKFVDDESRYISFDEALTWAKEHQPNLESRSEIASELRRLVANLCVKKDEAVKFYTSVGTPLDLYYGIDAFMEQGNNRVTLDVSLRDKDSFKADVLLKATIDEDGEVEVSEEEINAVAGQIAYRLNVPYQAAA